jgi:hypothetical protein
VLPFCSAQQEAALVVTLQQIVGPAVVPQQHA